MRSIIEGSLITWRVSSLLVNESGPYDVFTQIRNASGVSVDEYSRCIGKTEVSRALCCLWCTSLWVGIVVALVRKEPIYRGILYSAGAIWASAMVR